MNDRIIDTLRVIAEANPGVRRRRFAAAIVIQNKIIAVGQNKIKTDPFQLRYGKNPASIYLHAEIDVIKRAIRKLSNDNYYKEDSFQFPKNTELYVLRLDWNTDAIVDSAPCVGCRRAISDFAISSVVCFSGGSWRRA